MIDIHSNIKRLKTHIKLTDLNTNNSNGWKELISIVKSNTSESFKEENPNSHLAVNNNKLVAQDLTSAYLSNTVPALNSPIDFRTCNDCGKPVAYSALLYHLHTYCPGKTKGTSNGHSADTTREVSPTKGKNMKRNNSVEPDQSPSKKQRKSATPTVKKQRKVKQRNPTEPHLVDLDKQCGVELPESGVCGRSLTCKSHSMGAKRAVQGRSKPFDVLLAEYQKKNHIKNAAKGGRTKVQSTNQQQQVVKQKQQEKNVEPDIPVLTPEEETTQVLNGVSRSFPLPLETTVLTSTQTRTKYFRMREMLASSFSVRPGYSTPGYGAIHSRVGCIDLDRTTDYTFRIRVPQLVNQSSLHNGGVQQQFQSTQQNRARPVQGQQSLPLEALPQQQQATPQQMQPTQLLSARQTSQQQAHMLQFQSHTQTSQYPARVMGDSTSASHIQFDAQSPVDSSNYDRPITPKDAGQQVLMQQQRLQQRKKLEDASAQLDTASKLMQGGPINVAAGSVVDGSAVGPSVNISGQGRINVGLINGYDRLS